jgi:hypothetical protein
MTIIGFHASQRTKERERVTRNDIFSFKHKGAGESEIKLTVSPAWREKLNGFPGLRTDMRVTA